MRALVLAAGLGTRLRPLTDFLPKPLVSLAGKPMVSYVLEGLDRGGIKEALINIHYLPEKMVRFVGDWNHSKKKPVLFVQDEQKKIMGSGGALAMACQWLFEQEDIALVCNADVLAKPPLRKLREAHRKNSQRGIEVTLLVMPHPEAGRKYTGLRVENGLVISFEKSGVYEPGLFHFPGFYMISRSAVEKIPKNIECSVVDSLWRNLAEQRKIAAFFYDGNYFDLGTVDDLKVAEVFLAGDHLGDSE